MKEITLYTGKNQSVKVDLDNLLNTSVEVLQSIPYGVASKYPEFISVIEVCIEDCLDVDREIHDELSYKLAISEIVAIINNDVEEMEESTMKTNTNATVNTTTNNKEEKTMVGTVKGNLEAATQEMMAKLEMAKENIKVQAGETAEEYVERVDDSLNVVKGAFGDVLSVLDTGLGYTALKNDILAVIEAGQTGDSKHNLFSMARECREITDKYIKKVMLLGNPDKAEKLKELFEGTKGESIFTKFFSTLYWMGKKVARKLRKWFQVDEEKSVIGAICRSLAGFAGVLRAGVKLIWNTAKFAVSFVAAGVIAIADIIVNAIKFVVNKIKDWANAKFQKVDDDEFEEDFEDDFFEDEVEA